MRVGSEVIAKYLKPFAGEIERKPLDNVLGVKLLRMYHGHAPRR